MLLGLFELCNINSSKEMGSLALVFDLPPQSIAWVVLLAFSTLLWRTKQPCFDLLWGQPFLSTAQAGAE